MSLDNFEIRVLENIPASDYFLEGYVAGLSGESISYQLWKKQKLKASISLKILGSEAISLPLTPFAGIKSHESLHTESLEYLLMKVLHDLERRGVKKLRLIQRPFPYEEHAELIHYLLFKMGFSPLKIVNHQFFIGKKKIKNWVKDNYSRVQKKIKAQGLEAYSGPIRNFDCLSKIASWNKERGYDESIDEKEIIQQISLYPDRYLELSLRKDGQLVGACLAVRLTTDSIYYFKSAVDPKTEVKQVGEHLIAQLFSMAADLKVNFIDLGSSDEEFKPNHPLIFFKSRFSNGTYNKITWTREVKP
ncbi:GNAT family N-acetyltransferase [Algoriphagus namhaensis]